MPLTVDRIRMRHAEGFYCASECAPAVAFLLMNDRRLWDENAALRASLASAVGAHEESTRRVIALEDDNVSLFQQLADAELKRLREDREIVLVGGDVTSYQAEPCPTCAALRAEVAALQGQVCRARDRDGLAKHVHDVAIAVDIYAEGESVALLVANAAIEFIGSSSPCPHEEEAKRLREAKGGSDEH
jgi:hypothetical protein